MSLFLVAGIFSTLSLLMLVDEYIHRKRGLPKWERVGHPLDTLTVLIAIGVAMTQPFESSQVLYWSLAIFSCFFITKDEWIHHRECSAREMWLHAVLFLMHPVMFFAIFELWKMGRLDWLAFGAAGIAGFAVYQIVYWNWIRRALP